MITELFYSRILKINWGSRHTRSFKRIYLSVLRYKWTKNVLRARNFSGAFEKRTLGPGFSELGPVFQKLRKLFRPVKTFLVHLYLKSREAYTSETSCMNGTCVHIKNKWIKQLCNRKVRDFVMALGARKVSGAFEKQAPEPVNPNPGLKVKV